MSDYIFKQTGRRYSQQVISYTLKRDSDVTRKRASKRYLEQNLEKVRRFLVDNYQIFSSSNCLAMDEFGTNLGEAPRYAYSRRGLRAIVPRPGQRGFNYTLFLCVRNVEKQSVVSHKLIKNEKGKKRKGTDALDFYNFLKGIELPTGEQHYLLLDNAKIHYTSKKLRELSLSIEELAREKNIILIYLPSHSPQINPAELCFNTVRHLTEKSQSRNDEELNDNVVKIINILNQKPLTEYFRHCRDYFSFDKNGN
ncbi:2808_t:CDS:1 [Ambispora leptoticha]|uniref:2808_t:CDS:1 n=1 Tax=Ambispora leptoticha TaxID=144679 RepID=A0A9N9H7W3_9GLOM|nr:2808_t:CDS:1 [Ambispora leptoticha]